MLARTPQKFSERTASAESTTEVRRIPGPWVVSVIGVFQQSSLQLLIAALRGRRIIPFLTKRNTGRGSGLT